MEVVTFEDGSALCGDDAHVFGVRDADGEWAAAVPGREYRDATGRPWYGAPEASLSYASHCWVTPLPDTSLPAPGGLPLEGPLLLLLLGWAAWRGRRARGG